MQTILFLPILTIISVNLAWGEEDPTIRQLVDSSDVVLVAKVQGPRCRLEKAEEHAIGRALVVRTLYGGDFPISDIVTFEAYPWRMGGPQRIPIRTGLASAARLATALPPVNSGNPVSTPKDIQKVDVKVKITRIGGAENLEDMPLMFLFLRYGDNGALLANNGFVIPMVYDASSELTIAGMIAAKIEQAGAPKPVTPPRLVVPVKIQPSTLPSFVTPHALIAPVKIEPSTLPSLVVPR